MFKIIEVRKIKNKWSYRANLKGSDIAISIGPDVEDVIRDIKKHKDYKYYTILVYDSSGALSDIINEYE